MTARDPGRYLVGGTPPAVIVPAKWARWLDRAALAKVRRDYRGQLHPELTAVLDAIATAGLLHTTTPAAAGDGNAELPPVDEQPPSTRDLLDTGQAAARLGCTPRNVRDLADRGRLHGNRIGGRWLFDPADVDLYATTRQELTA